MGPQQKEARVAVVGLGAVTAAGLGVDALERAVRAGTRHFAPVRELDVSTYPVNLAAEVPADRETLLARCRSLGLRPGSSLSRTDLLALLAAEEAILDAGLAPDHADRSRTALYLGATTGGTREAEDWRALVAATPTRGAACPPLATLLSQPLSCTAEHLATRLGLQGSHTTFNTACSSAANAILLGAWLIRSGRAATVVVGGSDALTRLPYAGFASLQLLDPAGCRPFSVDRRGLTLGEGAAFLVLERLDHAEARGASVRGMLLGGAIGAEAHHPTAPEADGSTAARIMRLALDDAGLPPEAVDYVNAHGTGTPQNDVAESQAIRAALGAHVRRTPVSSTKSMLGHCLGAAGSVEAVVTMLGLERGFLPPTAGLVHPDPACDLDHVANQARPSEARVALSNSFGFGGNLTTLVLGLL